MAIKQKITATTDAAASAVFSISSDNYGPPSPYRQGLTVRVTGAELGVDEFVYLYMGDSGSPIPVNKGGNEGKILDQDNSVCTIYGRLSDVWLSKTATASAIGVAIE